ncbi:MAG: type II toxin-antitoxin system RelE/ParE family toxin [Bacteroidales bacterium]|nr:type II toxin-antitoxin system RelE/ParE family toxin [Bacteroidales bacterium]
MKKYKLKIEPDALSDIQEIANWYNLAQVNLGRRFQNAVIRQINGLKQNPQLFTIRYQEIRCMLVKRFPYMVHFHIDEQANTVIILAVISTSRNPKIWIEKGGL